MTVRNFVEKTKNAYIRCVKFFATFLGRSSDQATPDPGRSMHRVLRPNHAPRRGWEDQLIVVDIRSGELISRAGTGSRFANGMFLTPGTDRDVYYCSTHAIARVQWARQSPL